MKPYDNDTYSRSETYKYPNCTVTVHFPDLTPEERERRHKMLEAAVVQFVKEVERDRAIKEAEDQERLEEEK